MKFQAIDNKQGGRTMKTLVIGILFCFMLGGMGFAQEKQVSWEEHLTLAKSHAVVQINLREMQIRGLQDQIKVWKEQLKNIDAELLKIEEAEKAKKDKETKEGKSKPKETKK
jgi:LPS O-antigen subunit length determinant protein (WzzB/FepE family)